MLKSYKIALCLILALAFKNASVGAFLDDEGKKDILAGVEKLVKLTYQVENWNTNGLIAMYKAFLADLQTKDVNNLPGVQIAQEVFKMLEQNADYQQAFNDARDAWGEDNEAEKWIEFRKIAAHRMTDIIESRLENYKSCRDPKQVLTWFANNAAFDVRTNAAITLHAAQILLYKIRQVNRENGAFAEYLNLPKVQPVGEAKGAE